LQIVNSARESIIAESELAAPAETRAGERTALLNELEKQERLLRRFEPPDQAMSFEDATRDAAAPQRLVRIPLRGIDAEQFVGSIYGLNGRIPGPLGRALPLVRRAPRELLIHFVFIGIRASAVEQAMRGEPVSEWQIAPDVRQRAENNGVYPSPDNAVLAPVSQIRPSEARPLLTS